MPKRVSNLFDKIISLDHLVEVYGKAKIGKCRRHSKVNFEINSHTDDIEDFKKIYSQFEEQVKLNEKELARYSLLKKKYDIYLKKLEINKDFC